MEQMPMKLFLEAIAVFSIKRFLEQSYAGAIMIYLDYSCMETCTVFGSSGDAAGAFGH